MARCFVKLRELRAMRSSHRTGAVGEGRRGSIVRLICDSSELYLSATTDADWIAREGGSIRGRAATGSATSGFPPFSDCDAMARMRKQRPFPNGLANA
jgi:hypothetical protein